MKLTYLFSFALCGMLLTTNVKANELPDSMDVYDNIQILRTVSEEMYVEAYVKWLEIYGLHTVSENVQPKTEQNDIAHILHAKGISGEEMYLLKRVVETECYGCSLEQKTNVASVVLNRYRDSGKSLKEIITEPNQFVYGRQKISGDTQLAVENALRHDSTDGALFFQSIGQKNEFCGKPFKFYDEAHYFY